MANYFPVKHVARVYFVDCLMYAVHNDCDMPHVIMCVRAAWLIARRVHTANT